MLCRDGGLHSSLAQLGFVFCLLLYITRIHFAKVRALWPSQHTAGCCTDKNHVQQNKWDHGDLEKPNISFNWKVFVCK